MDIELYFEDKSFIEQNFELKEFNLISTSYIKDYPILYILYKDKSEAYIGQTTNARNRMKNHLKNPIRRKLKRVLLIGHDKFNQSATYNIETNLINYFLADGIFKLQNKSQVSSNQVIHNYYQKQYYNEEVFQKLWDKLRQKGLARNSSDVIQNKDVYKLSPFHQLSDSQYGVKEQIIDYCRRNLKKLKEGEHKVFLVKGEAGTGKSVVLSSLFNDLCNLSSDKDERDKESGLYKTVNRLLVNHSEVLKTYQTMSKSLPNMKKKDIMKPTSFINSVDKEKITKSDITLVDEAHLLLTSRDAYNGFHYENQLEEIIKRSKITIVIFDPKQVLKLKSYWDEETMDSIMSKYDTETLYLKEQFRMNASDEIIEWIDNFVEKTILPLPKSTETFDFQICNSSQELFDKITKLNKKDNLSRLVATFDFTHKKDGEEYYVDEEGINLPWNLATKGVWAEDPETLKQIGSIYTVQGFDLNNVGVILGPSVSLDEETNSIKILQHNYKDKGAFQIPQEFEKNFSRENADSYKEEIVLNSINILMKRAIKGLYIYAIDSKLNDYLLKLKRDMKL